MIVLIISPNATINCGIILGIASTIDINKVKADSNSYGIICSNKVAIVIYTLGIIATIEGSISGIASTKAINN